MSYQLPSLPYTYNALEPFIDAKTMEIHHTKHHQAYVDNLNKAIAGTPYEEVELEDLMKGVSQVSPAIRNNGGGHYNHSFFWNLLIAPVPGKFTPEELAQLNNELHSADFVVPPTPTPATQPDRKLLAAITSQFGSIDEFKLKFTEAALTRFGSGWTWLVQSADDHKLLITTTANQDNPLMNLPEIIKGTPILALDVWEHAYYLKYQNKRADYVSAFWNIVNWEKAGKLYAKAL